MKLKTLLLISLLLSPTTWAFADENSGNDTTPILMQHRFYIGAMTGYGNTDWGQLVSSDTATSYSTPTYASGSGAIIGALVGYQLTQYIAVEAQYIHYPTSKLTFAPDNPFYPGVGTIDSETNYYAIMPKVSAPFYHDNFEIFGTLGAALVTRSDQLAHISDYRPTFGFGLSYIKLTHWNFSVAFNYTPGTGVSSDYASSQYIPYLYTGEFIITYRI